MVPPRLISDILDSLRSKFGISSDAEISIEMDPGTFDTSKLDELLGLGINRVSLGVQAFQEELLRVCGRSHGLREVEEAIGIVKDADGLANWSLDLISSLPNQSLEMWEESLTCAVAAQPNHISVYDLQIEQGTKFGQLYTPGEFPLPTVNQSADFYKKAAGNLTKEGYEHYEISSYCKSGFECKHNQTYWQNRPFHAFGLAAASYINGTRFSRPKRMKEYMYYVETLENGSVVDTSAAVDLKDVAMDVVMLSLRTARGLDIPSFAGKFGWDLTASLCKAFEPYVESGHVIGMDVKRRPLPRSDFELGCDNDTQLAFIRLSDPHGFVLSNELIAIAFRSMSP